MSGQIGLITWLVTTNPYCRFREEFLGMIETVRVGGGTERQTKNFWGSKGGGGRLQLLPLSPLMLKKSKGKKVMQHAVKGEENNRKSI